MTTTRNESISTTDGSFRAHVAVPDSNHGPGIVVLQEIFGVNTYIEAVCDRLAGMGYVAMAPDIFWRQEPGFTVEPEQGEAGMNAAFEKMSAYDFANAAADIGATMEELRLMGETNGQVGLMGFCFGGTLAYLGAAALDPVCSVSYYGSGVAGNLDQADNINCPILFHFGGADPYLPTEDAEAVAARFAGIADAEVVVQPDAGHAFDNHLNPMFSNPAAAKPAWEATAAFLAKHLPVSQDR